MYQRRVRVTLTRHEAEVVRQALLRLSADPVARAQCGLDTSKTVMKRCQAAWRRIESATQKRDQAMAAKVAQHEEQYSSITVDLDVPLEGI